VEAYIEHTSGEKKRVRICGVKNMIALIPERGCQHMSETPSNVRCRIEFFLLRMPDHPRLPCGGMWNQRG